MSWATPERIIVEGRYVRLTPLDPDADSADLYQLSHEPADYQVIWRYLNNGPFPNQAAMHTWLHEVATIPDPLFFTVTCLQHQRRVGMISIMSIVPGMGRAELGHIWYSPLVQRTMVNTESTYLLLHYLFDQLHYRRVEWKCNNENGPSKAAALRMGFSYEGLFRQHMLVKGRNRDTAWFSIIDTEWPTRKAAFERYLAGEPGVSLRALNQPDTTDQQR